MHSILKCQNYIILFIYNDINKLINKSHSHSQRKQLKHTLLPSLPNPSRAIRKWLKKPSVNLEKLFSCLGLLPRWFVFFSFGELKKLNEGTRGLQPWGMFLDCGSDSNNVFKRDDEIFHFINSKRMSPLKRNTKICIQSRVHLIRLSFNSSLCLLLITLRISWFLIIAFCC